MKLQGVFVVAFAAASLAGCPEQATTTSMQGARPSAAAPSAPRGRQVASARLFAPLPDRGYALEYDRIRAPRRTGAYTWHAVELSEAHALRSIVTGMLLMTGPDGLPIRLRYERHVEHADGNWTWVGRDERGISALLTFGELAAFGTIPYRGTEILRVTTSRGQAWLVETDLAVLAARAAKGTRSRKPDYRLPPRTTGGDLPAMSEGHARVAVGTMPVVDLLLGYTPGFAAMLGGTSQALTRLNYLVEVTNQAYVNSNVNAQVRLVRTLQVAYPDNTSNETALEQLTGSDGSAPGNTPVPTSLAPLRVAREEAGADLVSLVRRFNEPEHGGCGIAWVLGGGQTAITAGDAAFGYSVVSDSQGESYPDGGYYCYDTTLAHELGHNMGAQHDIETASGENGTLEPEEYGRFSYSFGYRISSYFTVMAYGNEGQYPAIVFSSPESTYCGSPCGVANQADNARGLRQTIPIIATFRTPVLRYVRNDVDGDGRTDLLLHDPDRRELTYLLMDGSTVVDGGAVTGVGAGYVVGATGDVNADRKVDLIWTSAARDLYLWAGNGGGFTSIRIGTYPAGWTLAGAGDIDGDKRSDLLFHNPATRQFNYRIMRGATVLRSVTINGVGRGYTIGATGDLNADGKLDLVWTSAARDLYLWVGNGNTFTSTRIGTYPAGWSLAGAGDIDNDRRSDLLFHNPQQLQFSYRIMHGTKVARSALIGNLSYGEYVGSSGDLNGDGKLDLVWTNSGGPPSYAFQWKGDSVGFSSEWIGYYDPSILIH